LVFRDSNRSGTGPTTAVVRSSLDSFTTDIVAAFTTSTSSGGALRTQALGASFQNLTGPVTFRFVGYVGTGGTWRLNSVTFTGTIQSIPPTPPVLAEGFE